MRYETDQLKYGQPDIDSLRSQVSRIEHCLRELKAEFSAEPASPAKETELQLDEQRIRGVLKARRLRERHLGADLFADPAWDILLEAFATMLGNGRTSVSGLCHSSTLPPTTALRWIKKLEEEGWLRRIADQFDGRRHWMELTPDGFERLRSYFALIWPDALPL